MIRTVSLGKPPNPKQVEFFRSRCKHTCYGGAVGGGKSWAMRTKFILLASHYDGLKLLLLRRTLPELKENHILPMQGILAGIAQYKESDHVFIFPNGSRIKLGYCAAEKDVYQYQGQEYDVIGLEEATLFTEAQYNFILSRLRTTRTDFSPRMYYTCNPGGVGHAWVKRLFIDRLYQKNEKPEDYKMIRATIYDNTVLMESDPDYVNRLENLPEDQRRAFLLGDWDGFAGQYFTEWRRDLHVVDPFPIPSHWQVYRSLDYGLDMLACLWTAIDELGNAYVFRELCRPDTVVSEAARLIRAAGSERVEATYMPADMAGRTQDTGISRYETFSQNGLEGTLVRQGRVDGWLRLKEWLKPVDDGTGIRRPRLRIFSTCTQLIHDLPLLQYATTGDPSDVAKDPHDITHAPDALRYFCDGRPAPAVIPTPKDPDDPPEYEDQIAEISEYGTW